MTISQKAALSLLVSVVLVAGFSVLAFTGFFNLVETRFYNPSITRSMSREVERDAETIQNFLDELQSRFAAPLDDDAVQRSFLPNQAAADIFKRTQIYGLLMESQKGLQSVRFVDAGGVRLHFSTNTADILSRTNETISYRNYDETVPFVPYPDVAVVSGDAPRITLDEQNERIIFSFPFYDGLEVYRGTAFYSLSVRAVAERLVAEGRLKVGDDLSIVSVPPGMVSGIPPLGKESIIQLISSVWSENLFGLTTLDSGSTSSALTLVSAKTDKGLIVGRVADKSLFDFPQSMKMILLASIFLTIFLSIFLAFNLRADTMTVVQNRLKGLQLSLIREYYERKGEMDWQHWYKELEQRREEVRSELKRGVKTKTAPALLEDIDSLIDKSWDEILTAIGGKRETRLAIDEDKLQNILNRMLLAAGNSPVLPGGGAGSAVSGGVQAVMPFVQNAAGDGVLSGGALSDGGSGAAVQTGKTTSSASADDEDLEDLEELEELGDVDELGEIPVPGNMSISVDEPDEVEVLDADEDEAVSGSDQLPETDAKEAGTFEDDPAAGQTGEDSAAELLEELESAEPEEEVPAGTSDLFPKPRKENIQLVFGSDDIPTIVESSGLELVDDDDFLDSDDMEESPAVHSGEEFEELEELETAAAEELSALSDGAPPPLRTPDVASQIEFGSSRGEDEKEPVNDKEFVVVSPFAGMLAQFDDGGSFKGDDGVLADGVLADGVLADGAKKTKTSGPFEELNADYSLSLVHKPFQDEDQDEPQELSSEGPAENSTENLSGVIKQKNGVNYVNKKLAAPSKALDPGLKNLVDSVIGKK